MAKIKIGFLEFKTKKEAKEFTKKKVVELLNGETSGFDQFFFDLLMLHPDRDEKFGCGVYEFHASPNPITGDKNSPHMTATRVDGSTFQFSWNNCVDQTKLKDSDLNSAMRYAISDQVIKFISLNGRVCSVCNQQGDEVDHVIPFSVLKQKFIEHRTDVPKMFHESNDSRKMFLGKDSDFDMEWRLFHQRHAVLQVLCKSCHQSKTRAYRAKA